MKCNMGNTDRVIRGILGLGIIGVGVYFSSWLGLIGVIPLGTAIFRFCPAYLPFNFSTEEKR
ncbi:MAG: DUF2892 domain-containing protein [Leptospiraceae bacterium]|nr:DUF2892 domain-containing protein [Leptospiraceae bacterium]